MQQVISFAAAAGLLAFLFRPKKPSKAKLETKDLESLENFGLERVLLEQPEGKSIVLLGKFKPFEPYAIVRLEKTNFDTKNIDKLFPGSNLKLIFQNDKYSQHRAFLHTEHDFVKVDVTYPIPEEELKGYLQRYGQQQNVVLEETVEISDKVIEPWVKSIPAKELNWVYNLLEKKSEADRLIFEDPDPETGFMMHPNPKWVQTDLKSLNCLLTVHRKDVRSIRDLRGHHLPLLKNCLEKGIACLTAKYNIKREQLRIFFHYPPSFFHLHIHFTNINFVPPGTWIGRAHFLTDVIENLEIDPNYYQKKTLVVTSLENQPYAKAFLSGVKKL